jgi:alanine dehydrogenase
MPGAVPHTSTQALCNVTLPYIKAIADKGAIRAFREDRALAAGLNCYAGHITNKAVADALDLAWAPLDHLA